MLDSGLYIVATPIGNLADISTRAREVLSSADVVACEDTRVSRKLFTLLGLPAQKPFVSYEDHSEQDKADFLADKIAEGNVVALISDAGSPLISDPGYKLVRLCRRRGLKIYAIPGASAVVCALQLSGLPTNRFMFAGFIPNKDKARLDLFNELKNINTTLVFYETSLRLSKTLKAMTEAFSSREIAVVREITKIYEDCRNGTASELLSYYEDNLPKGEIVIVVSPPDKNNMAQFDISAELQKRLPLMSLKSAVKEVAELTGQNKNDIYTKALELKNEM